MFDIGWSELMLIGIVALIVIGPKELPAVLRTVGRTLTRVRRMAGEFQGQFQQALREADLSDMKDEITKVTDTVRKAAPTTELFDPLRSVRDEIRASVAGATAALAIPPSADAGKPAEAPAEAAADEDASLRSIREEIRASMAKAVPAAIPSPVEPVAQQDLHDLILPEPPSPLERSELPPPVFSIEEERQAQSAPQAGEYTSPSNTPS